jgi:hypothetical protein
VTRWQLQLDVPWRRRDQHGYADPGGIAVDRALHRPLAPAFVGDRYALAAVSLAEGAVVVTVRRGARWRDGRRVEAREIADGITHALADHDLARLCGAGLPRAGLGGRIEIPARLAPLLARWLSAARFTPRAADTASGRFVLDGDRLRAAHCEIDLSIVSRPSEALERLDRAGATPGLTCPTAFDVGDLARRCGRRDLRRESSDLHMVLLINPDRAPSLAEVGGRAALAQRLGVALAGDARVCRPDPAELTLLVGDYWPNRAVAARVAAAAHGLGVDIAEETVDLDTLAARMMSADFDLALALIAGEIGGAASLASWMVELAGVDSTDTAAAALAAGGVRALVAALEPVVPVLPLRRLDATYVASSSVPVTPLVQGMAYPVDVLARAS